MFLTMAVFFMMHFVHVAIEFVWKTVVHMRVIVTKVGDVSDSFILIIILDVNSIIILPRCWLTLGGL